MDFLKDLKNITLLIAIASFIFSVINFIINKVVTTKITQNDLKHLTKEVDNLKLEGKEYKGELKEELNKIFKRLGKIDKNITRRDAICEERHRIK